jgi:glycosyltransferase involved in cell wall biosynthesis
MMYQGSKAESPPAPAARVRVSVVMPVLNEGRFIEATVESLQAQLTPSFDLEILLIDGMSDDDTRAKIMLVCAKDPRVRLLPNPSHNTPAALNLGLGAASGDFVCIMGAHASYDSDYIAVCLQELIAHDAAGCSGTIETAPADSSLQARLVAWAAAHPFASSARSVRTQPEGYADTVPFPLFRKQALLDAGGYNAKLIRNQDNDMNQRLRALGFKLYVTAKTRCRYYPRPNIRSFLKHAFSTGVWNALSLRESPAALGLHHFVPLVFVTVLLVLAALASAGEFAGAYSRDAAVVLAVMLASHLGIGTVVAIQIGLREKTPAALWLAPLILAFHGTYGLGTLRGLFLPFPGSQAVPARGAGFKSPGVEINNNAVRDSEGTAP